MKVDLSFPNTKISEAFLAFTEPCSRKTAIRPRPKRPSTCWLWHSSSGLQRSDPLIVPLRVTPWGGGSTHALPPPFLYSSHPRLTPNQRCNSMAKRDESESRAKSALHEARGSDFHSGIGISKYARRSLDAFEKRGKEMEKFPRQEEFLADLCQARRRVAIHLLNGVRLDGEIESSDPFTLLLHSQGQSQLIYKHLISTITPMRGVAPQVGKNAREPSPEARQTPPTGTRDGRARLSLRR
jgi:host factor-I protein